MFNVSPVRAFTDNYIWVLHQGRSAFVVDPGQAEPVLDFLQFMQLDLAGILITHHHQDHIGGLAPLQQRPPSCPVYGPAHISGVTVPVMEGSTLSVFGMDTAVLEVPGHTLDHLAYLLDGHLFCGDTLFGAGCGRVFEGTMEQMHQSLQKLAALPDNTLIYPAHEYTLSNLCFAHAAEPANHDIQQRIDRDQQQLANQQPTLPSTLQAEKATNPFLRTHIAEVRQQASTFARCELPTTDKVFAALREWKNQF